MNPNDESKHATIELVRVNIRVAVAIHSVKAACFPCLKKKEK